MYIYLPTEITNKFACLIFCFAVFYQTNAQPDTLNPLKGDRRTHDPVMIKQAGTYYVFQTGFGIGVKTFFTEHDTTLIVYHAYTRAANGMSLLNIKPMYIDEEGWPTLDSSKKLFRRTEP